MDSGLSILALNGINELLKLINSQDQKEFERLLNEYKKQKTIPFDHEEFDNDIFDNCREQLHDIIIRVTNQARKKP